MIWYHGSQQRFRSRRPKTHRITPPVIVRTHRASYVSSYLREV
jgi:hypothetical protein